MESNRIQVKDLINIGLFTALFFVVITPVGIAGTIPVVMVLLPFLFAVIGGIPMMLLVLKTQKFGALSISGIIVSLLLFFMGHPGIALLTGITMPILADVIMALGQYKKWFYLRIGYIVFSLWSVGSILPFYFMRKSYFNHIEEKYGNEYTQLLDAIFTFKMIPLIILSCIIGALIGTYLARRLLKKHFRRAGMV